MSGAQKLRAGATKLGLRRALKRGAAALGFDLVKRNFYSPIPDWQAMPEEVWVRRSPLSGLQWDLEAQLTYLELELAPFLEEFRPPREAPPGAVQYHYSNGFYGPVDADVLYAMLRRLEPRRVIELGSGYSSLVIGAAARAAEQSGGEHPSHDVYDPFVRDDLRSEIASVADLHLTSANDVPLSAFEELAEDDVLFVDTTHTVKLDSDVNYIVLDVLPQLRPGVVVHFHDIFLPWEYPKEWLRNPEVFWAEQYLLQAFLAHNLDFEILFGVAAALADERERVERLIPSAPHAAAASGFWIRRR